MSALTTTAPTGRRFFVRSVDLARRLDLFLVAAVASVLGNRAFLAATGYPQVGNGTLHISHAIWGGLMMAIAIIIAVTYINPSMRTVVALLGGIGFGFFIDEVGKYITRDVNYFFKPAFSLIYITFLAMFFSFRFMERKPFGPNEAVINGLEALKSASTGQLDDTRRLAALELLRTSNATTGLATRVTALLHEVPALVPHQPRWPARTAMRARVRYYEWSTQPGFVATVTILFLLRVVALATTTAFVVLDGGGIKGFGEWMTTLTVGLSTLLLLVGIVWLPFSRRQAYRWLDAGLLVSLLIAQVFVYDQEQLVGTIGLAVTLVYWVLLRSAMRAERDRQAGLMHDDLLAGGEVR